MAAGGSTEARHRRTAQWAYAHLACCGARMAARNPAALEGANIVLPYRYSEWDGTQEIPPLDADEVLKSLTDDLMNFGDLQHALRNLLQRGMRNPLGQRLQGLRDLLQQLRQQRRSTLDRYNLSSVFDDIKKRRDEILDLERETLRRRLEDAARQLQAGKGAGAR